MKKFCTNCGHSNDQNDRICVECGASLTEEKEYTVKSAEGTQLVKNKKPLSLKIKILSIVGVLVIASLIGIYTWGTKTASAETVVTKFFEALQNEDAEALSKQALLSNGQAMTVKEANAFIDQYRDITSYELEDVAKVEKNGKVIGIFDAHRVIIPVQQLIFDFPHEGLALSLNGELVTNVKNKDGEYLFSGISPGWHEAEFIYEGEFAEFNYPFELEVAMVTDSSAAETIYVDLPLSSAIFKLETYNAENLDGNKVIIGDKKIPVDEFGETEEIGPLLLDGSTTAQAEVSFPWGTQLSEPNEITSNYQMIEFPGLEEKQHTALIDQLTIFAEEYVQAMGTRDSTVFTNVTKNQLGLFKDEIERMQSDQNIFMGSLIEVGVNEEELEILSDAKTITVDAVFQIEGDYYYGSEAPEPEDLEVEASIEFIFDKETEKWLVSSFVEDGYFLDVTPTATYEGSKKVFEKAITSKLENEQPEKEAEEFESSFDKESAEGFMANYNDVSVAAINAGDFSVVSGLVYNDGPRFNEQSKFVDQMYSKGVTEEHLSTSVESVNPLGEEFYEVVTVEKFIIHGTEQSTEKTYRTVTKVRVDQSGAAVYELISTKEI